MCQVNHYEFAIPNIFQKFWGDKIVVLNLINKNGNILCVMDSFTDSLPQGLCVITKFHSHKNIFAI